MRLEVKSSCSPLLLLNDSKFGFFLDRHELNRFFFFSSSSLGLVGDEGSLGKLSIFSKSSFSWDLDLEVRKIFLNLEVFGALMIAGALEKSREGNARALNW